jgi:hypothetical protein
VCRTPPSDGERLARLVLDFPQPRAGVVELDGDPLQVLEKLLLLRVGAFNAHDLGSPGLR